MLRRSALTRKTPLRPGGPLRRAAMKLRRRYTGPAKATRALVAARSGGRCEWPGCLHDAVDYHHRRGRGMGGVRGALAALLNAAANVLHVCRLHHRRVTSAHGEVLAQAKRMGWVLEQWQVPADVAVLTRHDRRPVRLTDAGGWLWQTDGGGWAPG